MGQSLAPHHLPIAINASTRVRNRQTKIKPRARVLPQHLLPPTAALQQARAGSPGTEAAAQQDSLLS